MATTSVARELLGFIWSIIQQSGEAWQSLSGTFPISPSGESLWTGNAALFGRCARRSSPRRCARGNF